MAPEPAAEHRACSHRQAKQPEDLAAQCEQQDGGDVAGEIEQLGQRGCPGQAVPAQRDQARGEETARARSEKTVVEADRSANRGIAGRRHAGPGLAVGHPRADQDIDCDGEQKARDDQAEPFPWQLLDRPASRRAADEHDRDHAAIGAPFDQALCSIVAHRDQRSEHRLQLVGAERLNWRNPAKQQCRHHDQPAAAGNRVDEARKDCNRGEEGDNPGLDHGPGCSRPPPTRLGARRP